jgi:hypothetical protein
MEAALFGGRQSGNPQNVVEGITNNGKTTAFPVGDFFVDENVRKFAMSGSTEGPVGVSIATETNVKNVRRDGRWDGSGGSVWQREEDGGVRGKLAGA